MTEEQTPRVKRGRPAATTKAKAQMVYWQPDVCTYLETMHNATGIPTSTLVNNIVRGYFTQRGAGSGVVLDITADGTVEVPVRWPKRHDDLQSGGDDE